MSSRKAMSKKFQDQLIIDYVPFVWEIACQLKRKLPVHIEVHDLVSIGIIGLMGAIAKFDPLNGASFKTFAKYRVRGAMLDDLRSADTATRSSREQMNRIEDAKVALEHKLLRQATAEEIAAHLNMSLDEYHSVCVHLQRSQVVSIESRGPSPPDGVGPTIGETLRSDRIDSPIDQVLSGEREDELWECIAELPEAHGLLLKLLYFEGMLLREIAELNGYTESRASQIPVQAVEKLRRIAEKKGIKQREEINPQIVVHKNAS